MFDSGSEMQDELFPLQIVALYKKLEREGNPFVGIERRRIGNN